MTWLLAKLAPWLVAAVGAVAAYLGVKRSARQEERTRRDLLDAKAANETNERMNHAKTHSDMPDDDVREWLRKRGERNSGS